MGRSVAAGVVTLVLLASVPSFSGRTLTIVKEGGQKESLDPVEFIKRFTIGMSYSEVVAALPKSAVPDVPSYITSDETFVLGVDLPGRGGWTATFRFDTLEGVARRPEQLIEISFSATVSSRRDPFDSIVRKVAASYGEPLQLDRTQDRFQEAGWRVNGGSILKVEYSIVPTGLTDKDASVDFVVRKHKPKKNAGPKGIA